MKKWLLIIGSGPTARADLRKISDHSRFDKMIVCHTHPTLLVSDIQYLVSYENDFHQAKTFREKKGLNTDYANLSVDSFLGVDGVFPEFQGPCCPVSCRPWRLKSMDPRNHHHYSGSSALLAVKLGLKIGYEKIIVCGCPLTGRHAAFRVGWDWIAPLLKRCPVRAMSGYPRELLGRYSEEWLYEKP